MSRPAYGAPDGHGRYGILEHEAGKVACHECGRFWSHLATHLHGAHAITAAAYRAAHGLSAAMPLVGRATAEAMSAGWARNAQVHLAALDASRDPEAARQAAPKRGGRWSPSMVAARQASAAARRVDLSEAQLAELGDVTDLPTWAERARALMAREGLPAAAIARATGMAPATVAQRLRRHPARPQRPAQE